MLVVLYVISAVVGFFASVYFQNQKFKNYCLCTLIAILTEIIFCFVIINKIINNIISVNFWSIFAILSLIAWQSAFLFNDRKNLLNYEFAFVLFAWTIYVFYFSIFNTNCWVVCKESHVTTEIVYLLTSFDSSEENIYGNGFIVAKVDNYLSASRYSYYEYYYQLEDGTPNTKTIPVNSTTIDYISIDESPYLEITTIRECAGYNTQTEIHALGFAERIYILHIQPNSILNLYLSIEH